MLVRWQTLPDGAKTPAIKGSVMNNSDDAPPDVAATDPGEAVSFPFDRMTVQRFRETFPRARWSEEKNAWLVPGTTARRRIDRWLAREASRRDLFADERGRDAYAFEPILSPYLKVGDTGFLIRTPYSRTAVSELRQIPFARWDGERHIWIVPFGSYDDLQHRWQRIEEAARRNEPDERRRRAAERKGTEQDRAARRRSAERRRRRLPLPAHDLPPSQRPIATSFYGIVVIVDVTGELVAPDIADEFYPEAAHDRVWAAWRVATLEELVHAWPARAVPGDYERHRGWWQPTIHELRDARKTARSRERRAARQERT
jgi:hypothetical protein